MPTVPDPSPDQNAHATLQVNRFFLDGTDLWALGTFTRFSSSPGTAVLIAKSDGSVQAPIWNVQDGVLNAVPDGSGGWYIQGDFSHVQGIARNGLAHILSDGSLDSFDPAANNTVGSMTSDGTNIYVGGFFTNIAGQARTHLAAFDIATGTLQSWAPTADGSIDHMWANSGKVYLSGGFLNINSTGRSNFASVLASDGSLTSFDPNVTGGRVNAAAFDTGIVFIGGTFDTVGGTGRARIAQVASSDGTLNSWYPTGGADASISALFIDVPNNKLYVGGAFQNIGGVARGNLTVLDTTSAAVGTLNPHASSVSGSSFVHTIDIDSGILYFGGSFDSISTSSSDLAPLVIRNNLAAYDLSGSGSLTSWNPDSSSNVNILLVAGSNIFVGAEFTLFDGSLRENVALLDSSTGLAQSLVPAAVANAFPLNAQILASDVTSSIIYFGGDFTTVGGSGRANIAAINRADGTLNSWYPAGGADDRVLAIIVGPDTNIYVGGLFTTIGGQSRSKLASIDPSGTVTSWNPTHGLGKVNAFLLDGNTLYIAGGGIKAYDVTTGLQITSFGDPTNGVQVDSFVYSMVLVGNNLYFGGDFSSVFEGVNTFTRNQFAAVNKATGVLQSWNPGYDAPDAGTDVINAMGYWTNGPLYVGGDFELVNLLPRPGFAVFPANQLPDNPTIFFGASRIDDEPTTRAPSIGGLDPTTGEQVWTADLKSKNVTFPHTGIFVEVFSLALPPTDLSPNVTINPTDQEVCSGGTATFTAAASGEPPITVQWQRSTDGGSTWNNLSGETSTTLSFTVLSSQNGYKYRAVFTNDFGTATTTAATLAVDLAPAVTLQPTNQTVNSGSLATFTANASGTPSPTVQWQLSTDGGSTWSNILGETSTTLDFIVSSSDNGHRFRAVFTNPCGAANTNSALLSVVSSAPLVVTNPQDDSVCLGASAGYWVSDYWADSYWAQEYWNKAGLLVSTAIFTASASGVPTPTVQWQLSTDSGSTWNNIIGETSTSLVVNATLSDDGNQYRAVFTNPSGSATTTAATLTVGSPPEVTLSPVDQTVDAFTVVTFTAAATSVLPFTVQWQVSTDSGSTWVNLPGKTTTTLMFIASFSQNGNLYRAVFTNACGNTATDSALLTVNNVVPPVPSCDFMDDQEESHYLCLEV